MRSTDNRYAGEQAQFELAMRLISRQARTHIINYCTGFSQDRIRKIYARYFKPARDGSVTRHRGKSPSSVEFFVRNPWVQSEASTLVLVLANWGLLRIEPDLKARPGQIKDRLVFGQRLCDAYEDFCATHPGSRISFEHAWNLLGALTERRDLLLFDCGDCGSLYVQDALALDSRRCPSCRVAPRRRRALRVLAAPG